MAKPIEMTPAVEGEDADRLLESLQYTCGPEESERRVAEAKKRLRAMDFRTKGILTVDLSAREVLVLRHLLRQANPGSEVNKGLLEKLK